MPLSRTTCTCRLSLTYAVDFEVVDIPAHKVINVLLGTAARGDGSKVTAQAQCFPLPPVVGARAVACRKKSKGLRLRLGGQGEALALWQGANKEGRSANGTRRTRQSLTHRGV
jgi:hypothetical protein